MEEIIQEIASGKRKIPGYEIGELVETNQTEHVFHGMHKALEIPVTIHVKKEGTSPEEFRQTGYTSASLIHPNIRLVHEGNLNDGEFPYIILKRCKNRLSDLLNEGRRLKPLHLEEKAIQTTKALNHAHRQGVYHGNLTPEQIFLVDGDVKVGGWQNRGIEREAGMKLDIIGVGNIFGAIIDSSPYLRKNEPLVTLAYDAATGRFDSIQDLENSLIKVLEEPAQEKSISKYIPKRIKKLFGSTKIFRRYRK